MKLQRPHLFLLVILFGMMGCSTEKPPVAKAAIPHVASQQEVDLQLLDNAIGQSGRPNILLIVADDLGYSDLGSYGSEIKTPNLDALANSGIKFTQFNAGPTCSVSRSMLMSGVDSHKAGLGNMHELMQANQVGKPGYEGHLNQRVVSIATLMRDADYHTYMVGKWHLGLTDETSPQARGFEKSFALLHGASNHYDNRGVTNHDPVSFFRENGQLLDKLPEDFGFSSDFYNRKLIEYIGDASEDGRPFFAYAAFTAPHWPLQAPSDYIDKYAGAYDDGYEVLRERRMQGLKDKGLIDSGTPMPPLAKGIRKWEALSAQEQKEEARKMEIYAAMIDNMDANIGKLIQHLKDIGEFENTFIFMISDNGADAADVLNQPKFIEWIAKFDNSYESMGSADSFVSLGRPWAHAITAPFRLWKTFTTEGGLRTPAIMYHPSKRLSDAVSHELVTIRDLFPTFLSLAGIDHPGESYQGREVELIEGKSLLPLLDNPNSQIHDDSTIIAYELIGRRSLRKGDWKLLRTPAPMGSDQWELFNLVDDALEQNDLSADMPEILDDMLLEWTRYEKENGLVYAEKSPF